MAELKNEPSLVAVDRTESVDKKFVEESTVTGSNYTNWRFIRTSAVRVTFDNVDFRYAHFDTCYFRNCEFRKCKFIGCSFSSSVLEGSIFDGCDFSYAGFEKTRIDKSILRTNCPPYENIKLRFARSLRVNFQSLGDWAGVNAAILVELDATRVHLYKAWHSNESYYRNKYKGGDRFRHFLEYWWFIALDTLWGNGESPFKLVRTIFICLAVVATIDTFVCGDWRSVASYVISAIRSPSILLSIVRPVEYSELYIAALFAMRLILFGLFLSLLIKRLNRR